MIACLIVLPSFITLVVLFFWTLTSVFSNGDDQQNQNNGEGGGEYRPWWEDMRAEEAEGIKIVLNLGFLAVACGTLFVPISKASSGMYERFNEGVLAASMFMFGNMLFVSFWYELNFGQRDEEQQNNQNNNGYYNNYGGNGNNYGGNNNYGNNYYNAYWYMDERERIQYHQKVVSYCCLALGIAFFAAGTCIHGAGAMTPEDGNTNAISRTNSHAHVAVQFDLMNQMWQFLSLVSVVVFAALFVASCVLTGGEGADRMMEEGRLVNLILVLLWAVLCTIAMMVWGSHVSTERGSDSLSVGLLYGSTKYFAALLFMVCILFANPTFDEKQREEGIWVATATSFACFFLSLVYFVFAQRARKYQVSVIDANSEKVTVLAPMGAATGYAHSSSLGGDFVRVDEHGMITP